MDYIIDGYGIPVAYDLCVDGAHYYIPNNLPKDTRKQLETKLKNEQDVVSIRAVPELVAKYYGDKFQKAHDTLVQTYRDADLKFSIRSDGAD